MPYLNETGLAYYNEKIQPWISSQPVKTLPSSLYPWTLTEKAGAVSLWPVGGTPLKPSVDFLFAETPPASGDKGPDNPSTISGVSNIHITRCGKNLLQSKVNNSFPYFDHGITYTDNGDGTYTANGTCPSDGTNDSWLYFSFSGTSSTWLYSIPVYASVGKYVISGCPSGGSSSTYMIGTQTHFGARANDFGSGGVLTVSRDEWTNFFIKITKGQTVSNMKFAPQIEAGEVPTAFEKPEYNNYTIDLGSTYYGGTLDVASGVMTVTWSGFALTGDEQNLNLVGENQGKQRLQYAFSNNGLPLPVDSSSASVCTHSSSFSLNQENTWGHYYVRTIDGVGYFAMQDKNAVVGSTLAAYRDWLALQYSSGTPVAVAYRIAVPYTVQLSPVSISALAQTDKYTPRLNTVYTDASAVQVGYVKSPIREEFELQQAIVAQGGNI